MLIVPRLVRAVVRLRRAETTVVAAVGLCFAFALLARKMGYSVALGAFLCGALVAESGAAKLIEHRIEPVRDLFAAVFFVSVGMLIDPRLIWAHAGTVLALTGVVVVGKLVGVTVGAFVAGYGVPTAVQTALSLGQIGEFSFIIAGVGLSLGATRSFLYPVAVAVSALTTLLTPFAIRSLWAHRRRRRSPPAAHAADLRGALRRLGAGAPVDARAPDRLVADPPPGEAAGAGRGPLRGDCDRRIAVGARARRAGRRGSPGSDRPSPGSR